MDNEAIHFTDNQKKLIEEGVLAFATCDIENVPNVVFVDYCKVVYLDKILIAEKFLNKTKKNFLSNERVSLAIWNEHAHEGYQFKGRIEYFTDGKWMEMLEGDDNHINPRPKGAVLFTVDEIWDLVQPRLLAKR